MYSIVAAAWWRSLVAVTRLYEGWADDLFPDENSVTTDTGRSIAEA